MRGTGVRHHSWVKVKVHNYVCRKCGMRKVNIETRPGQWAAEWHTPDGDVMRLALSPACAEGSKTAERLAWLADWQTRQGLTAERAASCGGGAEAPEASTPASAGSGVLSTCWEDAGERPAPVTHSSQVRS